MSELIKNIKPGDLLKFKISHGDVFSYKIEKDYNFFYPWMSLGGIKIEDQLVLFLGIQIYKDRQYVKIFYENTIMLVLVDNDYSNLEYFEKFEV